jgi:hypothetical protein
MFAQLIEGGTTPARRTDMDQIVTDDLQPLAAIMAITTGTRRPISVWEVNART